MVECCICHDHENPTKGCSVCQDHDCMFIATQVIEMCYEISLVYKYVAILHSYFTAQVFHGKGVGRYFYQGGTDQTGYYSYSVQSTASMQSILSPGGSVGMPPRKI